MQKLGKPVKPPFQMSAKAKAAAQRALNMNADPYVPEFSDTEAAFQHLDDKELKRTYRMYQLMGQNWLVDTGSRLALLGMKLRLPLVQTIAEKTIYSQFVGGTTLLNCQPVLDRIGKRGSTVVMSYGAEGKEGEDAFNMVMNEILRAIDFASRQEDVTGISIKVTGFMRFDLLAFLQTSNPVDEATREEYRNALKRLDAICNHAAKLNVMMLIDAEETWIQDTIDRLCTMMMRRYNRDRIVIFNTVQMYRHDRLQFLLDSYEHAQKVGYKLGVKIVRGAYMEKERAYATQHGLSSPIHPNKAATDDAYNTALRFCLDHYEEIATFTASHNEDSNALQAQLMLDRNISPDHPHIHFCQLYGMSDHITYNLADAGFRSVKFMPYGPVKEVVPYLIRRAMENSSVAGEAGRELQRLRSEMKRRGLV